MDILKYVDLCMRKRAYVSQEEELHKTDRKEEKSESETTPPHHPIVLYIVASGVPLLSDKSRRVRHPAAQVLRVVVVPAPYQAERLRLPGPAGLRLAPMLHARTKDRAVRQGYR